MKISLRRLLVPIDFSDESEAALTYGLAFAERFDASLHLLHVVEGLMAADTYSSVHGSRRDFDRAIATKAWDDLRSTFSSGDRVRLRAELSLEWGTPFAEITRYAREHEVDLIAMGTHGRGGGIKRLLMGSVAENVVRSATCPVMTVRHSDRQFVRG